MNNTSTYDSVFAIKLAQIQALNGSTGKFYDSVYETELEILKKLEEGGGGGTGGAKIDDNNVSTKTVWSSNKTNTELSSKATIDDDDVSTKTVWSSQYVKDAIEQHYTQIDDNNVSNGKVWSSEKITSAGIKYTPKPAVSDKIDFKKLCENALGLTTNTENTYKLQNSSGLIINASTWTSSSAHSETVTSYGGTTTVDLSNVAIRIRVSGQTFIGSGYSDANGNILDVYVCHPSSSKCRIIFNFLYKDALYDNSTLYVVYDDLIQGSCQGDNWGGTSIYNTEALSLYFEGGYGTLYDCLAAGGDVLITQSMSAYFTCTDFNDGGSFGFNPYYNYTASWPGYGQYIPTFNSNGQFTGWDNSYALVPKPITINGILYKTAEFEQCSAWGERGYSLYGPDSSGAEGQIVCGTSTNIPGWTDIKTVNGSSLLGSGNIEIDLTSLIDDSSNVSTGKTWSSAMDSSIITEDEGVIATAVYLLNQKTSSAAVIDDSSTSSLTVWSSNKTNVELSNVSTAKQDVLVSGTNIKTIDYQPLLGSGNLTIGSDRELKTDANSASSIIAESSYDLSTNKVNSLSVRNILALTTAEYAAIVTKDVSTLYIITDASLS